VQDSFLVRFRRASWRYATHYRPCFAKPNRLAKRKGDTSSLLEVNQLECLAVSRLRGEPPHARPSRFSHHIDRSQYATCAPAKITVTALPTGGITSVSNHNRPTTYGARHSGHSSRYSIFYSRH